jgi:hypothetical protein
MGENNFYWVFMLIKTRRSRIRRSESGRNLSEHEQEGWRRKNIVEWCKLLLHLTFTMTFATLLKKQRRSERKNKKKNCVVELKIAAFWFICSVCKWERRGRRNANDPLRKISPPCLVSFSAAAHFVEYVKISSFKILKGAETLELFNI